MSNNDDDKIKNIKNLPNSLKPINEDDYYEDLYNDLPKEVVELLMKTHPLMDSGQGEEMAERYMTKHTRKLEAEEVKAIRQSELKKHSSSDKTENQQEDNVEYLPKRGKNESSKDSQLKQETAQIEEDDFEDDLIQLVKHKSRPNNPKEAKSKVKPPLYKPIQESKQESVETKNPQSGLNENENELPIKNRGEFKKTKPARKPNSMRKREKKDFAGIDFDKMATEKNLDEFFGDDVEDNDKKIVFPGGRKVAVSLLAVGIILVGVLAIRTVSLTGKLQKANAQLQDLNTAKDENNELKLQMLNMEEELSSLKNSGTNANTAPEQTGTANTQPTPGGNAAATKAVFLKSSYNLASKVVVVAATAGDFDYYTVVDGDIIWNISQKLYGDGSKYNKILEANGLTENDKLKIGQKLKIPKLQ